MYVDLHVIKEALEKEYNRLAAPVLEGKARGEGEYELRIGELRGIRIAANTVTTLFARARGEK